MLSLPLLVTTLALAPTGNTSRLELDVGASVQSLSFTLNGGGLDDGASLGGQGGVGVTLFASRVVDDDAPPSLQPYLQAVSQLHVDGGAGGFHAQPGPASTLPPNDSHNGYADLSALGYADRLLYGYLGIGTRYRSDTAGSFTSLALPLTVSGGVRLRDVRLSIGWSVAPTRVDDRAFEVPFWGGALAQLYAVVQRRVGLLAEVDVVEGGASARGGATGYFQRRFSAGVSVNGGHGHESAYGLTFDQAGAGVSFQAWAAPRVAVAVDYSFQWSRFAYANGASEADYTNTVGLSFAVRPR
ncbi:MAG TPA: hypothetical protein VF334_18335 [Polyangia bacterium]